MSISAIGAMVVMQKMYQAHRTENAQALRQVINQARHNDYYFSRVIREFEERLKYNPPHMGNYLDVYI